MAKIDFGELAISALSPVLNVVVTAKISDLFDKIYKHSPEEHSATLRSMYIGIVQLGKVTGKTRTKIDDAVVDALKVAIETSADQYGVDLSE